MTGTDLQQTLIDLGHKLGYIIAHFRPAMKADGTWRTPVAADGKGFPDLFLVHPVRQRVIWIECKSEREKVSPEQEAWHDVLARADQEIYVVRPKHYDEIAMILMLSHKPNVLERQEYDSAVVYLKEAIGDNR